MYEVIWNGYSKHFDIYDEAASFAKEMSEQCGSAVLKDWEDMWVIEYENRKRVASYSMDESDDSDEDWEEEWADDYDEPYDPYDEVGYDPYTGGYDSDL